MVSALSFGRKFSRNNDQCETVVLDCSCEQYCIILPSRNKSFPQNPFEFLHIRESLVSRSSNVSSIEARGSSLEGRVSSVNLLLSGTVVNCSFVITENRNKIPQGRD